VVTITATRGITIEISEEEADHITIITIGEGGLEGASKEAVTGIIGIGETSEVDQEIVVGL